MSKSEQLSNNHGRLSNRDRKAFADSRRAQARSVNTLLREESKRIRREGVAVVPSPADVEVPPIPLTPQQRKAREILLKKFSRAERDSLDIDLELFDGLKAGYDSLFRAFQQTPEFESFYKEAEHEALFNPEGRGSKKEFRGGLFAAIAAAYLRITEAPQRVVISPEDTLKVTKAVNPDRREIRNPYNQIGLDGVYVPDGLLLERAGGRVVIRGIYETSLSGEHAKYVDQVEGFQIFRRKMGQIAQTAKFLVVVPNSSPVAFSPSYASDIEIIRLPFQIWDFNDYEHDLVHDYTRSDEYATLADLRLEGKTRAAKIRQIGEPAFFRLRKEATVEIARAKAEEETTG